MTKEDNTIELLYTKHDAKRGVGIAVFTNGAEVTFPEDWLVKLSRAELVEALVEFAYREIMEGRKKK